MWWKCVCGTYNEWSWKKCMAPGCGLPRTSSEASEGAKPPTREGGGDRVERFDGLHASEASGTASAITGGGAGKATEPGAAGEALRDERSQLPNGLPSAGGHERERSEWPPLDVVDRLCRATEILLHEQDYDGEGYEELGYALSAAKTFLAESGHRIASVKPINP